MSGPHTEDSKLKQLTARGMPYELYETVTKGVSCKLYARAPRSIAELLTKLRMGDAAFVSCGKESLSGKAVSQHGLKVASALREQFGVTPGSRVGIALDNSLEWVISFYAITSIGAIPILFGDCASDLNHLAAITGCELIIVDDHRRGALSSDLKKISSPYRSLLRCTGWDQAAAIPADRTGSPRSNCELMDAIALVSFTSGTSGAAKAVITSQRGITNGLMNTMLASAWARSALARSGAPHSLAARRPCVLLLAPLHHIGGYGQFLLSLMTGSKLVFLPQWSAAAARRAILDESITSVAGASPQQIWELLHVMPDPGPLQFIGVNGVVTHATLLACIARQWPCVTVGTGYGLTETSGLICAALGDRLRADPSCCGQILPTMDFKLVGEDGEEVSGEDAGEIWLRGASLMCGYFRFDDSSTGLIDGWFPTGDIGIVTEDGQLHLSGRIAEAIHLRGRRLGTLTLERAICGIDWVTDACVLPNDRNVGSKSLVVAVVPTEPGQFDADVVRITLSNAAQLDAEHITVVAFESLPRNRSGKINRIDLNARLSAEHQKK